MNSAPTLGDYKPEYIGTVPCESCNAPIQVTQADLEWLRSGVRTVVCSDECHDILMESLAVCMEVPV